jgi:hypothetical protein
MGRAVFAVFEQDRGDARVVLEQASEFGAAVAAMTDDSSEGLHWLIIHYHV